MPIRSLPDAEMKAAAENLFPLVDMYGKNFTRAKLAEQSLRYIRIIDALNRPENSMALSKVMLTSKLTLLAQAQQEYEQLYMSRGNAVSIRVAPSKLRMSLNNAIKKYIDEVRYLAGRYETDEWKILLSNLLQRFDELTVSSSRTQTTVTTATSSLSINGSASSSGTSTAGKVAS